MPQGAPYSQISICCMMPMNQLGAMILTRTEIKIPFHNYLSNRVLIACMVFLIIASLIFSYINPAFGAVYDDKLTPKVTKTSTVKINSSYLLFYKVCPAQFNPDVRGFLVSGDILDVPVIVSKNTKSGQCQTYGVKVLTENQDKVQTHLIFNKDIPKLIQDFEIKKKALENQLVKENQKLNIYHKTNNSEKKITEQIQKVEQSKEMIKSARSSIILLKSI